MQEKSLFISSCTRREMARRRPTRGMYPVHVLLAIVVLALALGVALTAHGGL